VTKRERFEGCILAGAIGDAFGSGYENLEDIANLGTSGYVVDSVPLAIAAANQVDQLGMEEMFNQLVQFRGDTDTNCSIAGQVPGNQKEN